MSVTSISVPQTASAPQAHHTRHAHPAAGAAKADESIEQLAEQGDPTAIAELKAERQQPGTSQGRPASGTHPAAERGGASEPGKETAVDEYA